MVEALQGSDRAGGGTAVKADTSAMEQVPEDGFYTQGKHRVDGRNDNACPAVCRWCGSEMLIHHDPLGASCPVCDMPEPTPAHGTSEEA